MEIMVLNTEFEPVCAVDDYISIVWTDRYSEEGEFTLVLSPTSEKYGQLILGYYMEIPLSEHTMIIETVDISSSRRGGQQMTVSGRSMESILERRLCMSLIDGGAEPEINDSVPILARMYGVVMGGFMGIPPNIYTRDEYGEAVKTYFKGCPDVEIPDFLCSDEEPWSMNVPLYSEDREFSRVKTAKVRFAPSKDGSMWKRETYYSSVTTAPAALFSSGLTYGRGDVVNFKGGYHYVASTAASPTGGNRSAGKAKITLMAPGAPHPYHLIGEKGGSNVYGWVDAADIQEISSEIEDDTVGGEVTAQIERTDRIPLGMYWGFLNDKTMPASAVVKNCYYRRVPNFTVYPIMAYPAWVQTLYNFGLTRIENSDGETEDVLTAGESISGFIDGCDKSCAEIIKSYCDMSMLGYQITRNGGDIQFRVLYFTDKSLTNTEGNEPVILSSEFGNLSSERYSKTIAEDYTIACCIPTYASNEEVSELLALPEITAADAALGMNALTVYEAPKPQARGLSRIEKNTGDGGDDDYNFGNFGEQALKHLTDENKRGYSVIFDGEMIQGGQFFDNIELGDVVSLMNCFGERFKAVVTEIVYSCDKNGIKKTPTFKTLDEEKITKKFVVTDISPTDYKKGWKIGVCGFREGVYFRQSKTILGEENAISYAPSEDVLFPKVWKKT